MSNNCPPPIDWLDYLEGEWNADLEKHLGHCPSCRETLSLLEKQAGNVPDARWAAHISGLDSARLSESRTPDPAPAELWFSSGEWTFQGTEYRPPERSLVLVLSPATSASEHSWYDIAPVRTDVEEALPTDLLLTAEESSFNCALRVILSFESKVERRQLDSRVGSLTDIDIVISAINNESSAWRWGNPLESQEDPRLWWGSDFSETMEALRGPWLQSLDSAGRVGEDPAPLEPAEILDFVPKEWVESADERELLAASSGGQKKTSWELTSAFLQLEGSLDVDWAKEMLRFSIRRHKAEGPLRMRLLLYLKGSNKPEESEEFEPGKDRHVYWALANTPGEVERLRAWVMK
jgi:hypothetical protein